MNTKDLENYNFISDLFITAAPEVPDAISSNAIEQKIINKQIHRRIKFEPKSVQMKRKQFSVHITKQ